MNVYLICSIIINVVLLSVVIFMSVKRKRNDPVGTIVLDDGNSMYVELNDKDSLRQIKESNEVKFIVDEKKTSTIVREYKL